MIADEQFVLLTTFKRDGSGVGTPVWIAPLPDGRAGFTTSSTTWKAKRLRRDPRVTLQACDRRGTPRPGAPVVEGTGVVVTEGPEPARVAAAISAKYGWQVTVIHLLQRLGRSFGRPYAERDAAVVITLNEPGA